MQENCTSGTVRGVLRVTSIPTANCYREEIVILTFMLTAGVNAGYENIQNEIIEMIDDVPVSSFSQFVEMVDGGTGQFLELTTNLGNIIVLDREESIAVNDEILARYGIPVDRVVFQ